MNLATIFYALLIVLLCYLTFDLSTDYQNNSTRSKSFFIIWIIDTIDLFIHETGHLVFKPFGRFMEMLGGSLLQIIIPLLSLWVFAKSTIKSLPFTMYWVGQSIVNVSVYIGDAPFLRLQLISKAAIHDWKWIMNYLGTMEYAEDISSLVNVIGLLVCYIGISFGIYIIIRDIKLQQQKLS